VIGGAELPKWGEPMPGAYQTLVQAAARDRLRRTRRRFLACQYWWRALVARASQARSFASSISSAVAKNLTPLTGGEPNGLSSLVCTRMGMSCS